MNKADRKAMKAAGPAYMPDPYGNFREGFQAVCEHKQREIDALKIRMARLEHAGNYLAAEFSRDWELGRVSIDCKNALDKWDSVYQKGKSHTQSLAEVQAEVLREFAHKLTKVDPEEWDCGDVPDLLDYEINHILREAKE